MSIWRSYCASLSAHSGMPVNFAEACSKLRHVRHATFGQLSSAGYDVRTYDDGAVPLKPEMDAGLSGFGDFQKPVVVPQIARLRDVVMFGNSLTLLPDGRYCYFETKFGNYNIPGCGPGKGIYVHADHSTNSMLIPRQLSRHMRCIEMPGRYFSLLCGHYGNFGHFVHDILSRIYYENLGVIVPGRDRIMAPEFKIPMMGALFSKVFKGYEIVHVPITAALLVEELLLPANLCKPDRFNPAAAATLARRMRRIFAPYAGKEKYKVCVSRNNPESDTMNKSTMRDIANMEAYETLMRKLGYRIVNTSRIDPEEQFALWTNTTDIVGIHGAGMMNMMMMPPGNYTEIMRMEGPDLRRGKNWIARCAIAAGHSVAGLPVRLGAKDRPELDLRLLETLLLNGSFRAATQVPES